LLEGGERERERERGREGGREGGREHKINLLVPLTIQK